ncbi:hypothetical protein TA3x_000408 [Tundrisphaera sp. TA3]|uniref:hypothetical protein n=1 Tax=Tundrisphaera sp. TA3 TaxID=3435775 RepID=UPI003EBC306B
MNKECRSWLPEFGQDNECCEGKVIDVDVWTEQGFGDMAYPPCPICSKSDFDNHINDLLADNCHEDAAALVHASRNAIARLEQEQRARAARKERP